MNWYNGNIAEAVAESKSKNAIFVVYVEGEYVKVQKANANYHSSTEERTRHLCKSLYYNIQFFFVFFFPNTIPLQAKMKIRRNYQNSLTIPELKINYNLLTLWP